MMGGALFGAGLAVALAAPAPRSDTRGLTVTPLVQPTPLYRRRVALVVGIDRYEQPGLRLSYATHDAQGVALLLRERFGFDEVRTVFDRDATAEGLRAALAALEDLHEDDGLVVFWAGHGTSAPTGDGGMEGFLVPSDGTLAGDPTRNLSMVEVRHLLLERIPARHKLVIVDACYAGTLAVRGGSGSDRMDAAALHLLTQRPVVQVLTAGRADETVLDAGPGGHSVFTGRLLEALEGVDDYVTASELAARVQRQVRTDAYARGHAQSPDFERVYGDGDFVLVPRGDPETRAPRRATSSVSPSNWGFTTPGLAHPEPGRVPFPLARVRIQGRPYATRSIRSATTDGFDESASSPEGLVEAGATLPVGRWRLDLDAGGALDLQDYGGGSVSGTLALQTPRWGRPGLAVALRPVVGRSALQGVRAGGGSVVVGGDAPRLRWTGALGSTWRQPRAHVGLRWGSPGVAVGIDGWATGHLGDEGLGSVDQGALARLDLARPRGSRVQLGVGWAGVWVSPGESGVTWLQRSGAVVALEPTGGSVSGPGLIDQVESGETGSLASPGLLVELAWTIPAGAQGRTGRPTP